MILLRRCAIGSTKEELVRSDISANIVRSRGNNVVRTCPDSSGGCGLDALDLYTRMLALYPDRVNPGALWASARALKH